MDDDALAERIAMLIYSRTQLVLADAEDLAWDVLDVIHPCD